MDEGPLSMKIIIELTEFKKAILISASFLMVVFALFFLIGMWLNDVRGGIIAGWLFGSFYAIRLLAIWTKSIR